MAKWPTERAASTTLRGVGRCKPVDGGLKVKLIDPAWEAAIVFKNDKIPPYAIGKEFKGDMVFSMNGKKDQIYSLYPANGLFKVKFADFGTKKDEALPSPQLKRGGPATGKDGSHYVTQDYQFMIANLKIIEGPFEGVTIPYFLRYYFKMFVMDGEQVAGIIGEGKRYGDQLIEFLDVFGAYERPLPWKDNLLPDLMKILLQADRTVTLVMKKGYPDSLMVEDAELDDDLDSAEVEPESKEDAD